MNPVNIQVDALPAIPWLDSYRLPKGSGIYFVCDADNKIHYIGMSKNINQRWHSHHRRCDFREINGCKVRYVSISDLLALPALEAELIEIHCPPLNIARPYLHIRRIKRHTQAQGLLERIEIKDLGLDPETEEAIIHALNNSGQSLGEFIKEAIRNHAKTVAGKAQKHSKDLSNIRTGELLTSPAYKTHPMRAPELTRRAIQAIKRYNQNIATAPDDRWMITQGAIADLTGSREYAVKKAMEPYKKDIDSHNQVYGLTPYTNRKKTGKGLKNDINLAEMVPDGQG